MAPASRAAVMRPVSPAFSAALAAAPRLARAAGLFVDAAVFDGFERVGEGGAEGDVAGEGSVGGLRAEVLKEGLRGG